MKTHMIPVDENLGEMLTWAVRYSLGRSTYAVSDTCRFITPLIPYLDERTICCIHRDIIEQRRLGGYGDSCDEEDWMKLKDALTQEISRKGWKQWTPLI